MTERGTLGLGPDRTGRALVMEAGRIVHCGEARAAAPRPAAWIDAAGALHEPGAVNAHTHVYSGLAPLGMPPPDSEPESFPEILEKVWWRLDRALDAASLHAAARLYVAEALLAGTTTLVDHHESPGFIEGSLDVLADACEELGIRAVLCYGATERNGGTREARRGLAECSRFVRENRRPDVRGVVGLHASFTVSDDTLRRAGELCRELGTPMHVHLAEDAADVDDARRRGWPGPLERLLALGALPPGSILAHGVHLDREQVRTAADHGLWLVQNPRSNRGNRVGYPGALAASRRVALGTDGYPAAMDDEVAALEQEAAAHGDDLEAAGRRAAAGRELAAELFGLPFSPLAVGGAADVVVQGEAGPRHVVVGGHLAVEERRLTSADLGAIRDEARREAPHLWQRMRSQ